MSNVVMISEKIRAQILNGMLRNHKNHLAGFYKGYYITVELVRPRYIVRINAHSDYDQNNVMLQTFLTRQKTLDKHLVDARTENHAIVLTIAATNLVKNIPERLNSIIDPIINYLAGSRYVSGCETCGSTTAQINRFEVNGQHHHLCENCAREVAASLQENKQMIQAQKSNLISGAVGAFLGALIGAVLWVIIYKLGYIAGLAGAVTAICALKGYEMFGKHLDVKGIITSVLIMIVVIYVANQIAWTWELYDALQEEAAIYGRDFDLTFEFTFGHKFSFFGCYRSLGDLLDFYELTGDYHGDLVAGYLLTALASIGTIINAFKNSRGSFSMKKMS